MVRKRDAWTRARAKRSRPKTPAPKTGWVIADLARMTGVSLRTLRHYVQLKLLRPLEFRGTATRYARRELLRLLGVMRLRAEARASLSEIQRRLDALSDQELEAWLVTGPLPAAAAAALELPGRSVPPSRATQASASDCVPQLGRGPVETWQRVCLLPGLELMLRCDASPAVRRAAQSIYADYVGA